MENTSFERNLILSVLKSTAGGPISYESIIKDANLASVIGLKLLQKLQKDELLYCGRSCVEANSIQRLKLALLAMRLGADPERVSALLSWQEFEAVASAGLEANDYSVTRNLRLKDSRKRWEIDVVGFRRPMVLCVDCKCWRRGLHVSALSGIVEKQIERTRALARMLPGLTCLSVCSSWKQVRLVPVILSLTMGETRYLNGVPVVSILQLQDFLMQLPAYTGSVFSVVTSL